MAVSDEARSYRVASKKIEMRPGGNPSGPVWKKLIFVGSVWEQKKQSRSHRSVSRNTFGPKMFLGWHAMTRTALGRQFCLGARNCTFAKCSLRYHPTTSSDSFVYRVTPQIRFFCYRVAPRI